MRLREKVVIVTGGSRGIGKEISKVFAREGAKVIIAARDSIEVEKTTKEIIELGGVATGKCVDVTIKKEIDKMIEETLESFGRIDILINNAGVTADAKLEKMTEDQFDEVIDINLKGVFLCAQAVSSHMKKQGNGVILNTSSVVGMYGNFGQTNYAASKWGVIGMTKTWAKELGKYGIRVNAVAPGFTLTEMVKKMPENILENVRNNTPLKSIAEPSDIANAFLYLASDDARFVTGSVLNIDGGIVL